MEYENDYPATCMESGSYDYVKYCYDCNAELYRETKTVELANEYHWISIIPHLAPACDRPGNLEYYRCEICGTLFLQDFEKILDMNDLVLSPTGHSFYQEKVEEKYLKSAATCTNPAKYYVSCSKCNASSKGAGDKEATFESGKVLDHKYGGWKNLDAKQHQKVCEHDATHVEKENHKWDSGKVTKEPIKVAEGVKTYTCTVC